MNDRYPNPWNFSNVDSNLVSSNEGYKIEYGETSEIAMGGPLGGKCYLIRNNGKKIKISEWAGGPVVWNASGKKVAIPIWTNDRNQKIMLIDIEKNKLMIFSREFRVLSLDRFDHELIIGIDSPIHNSTEIIFDTEIERIESQVGLL